MNLPNRFFNDNRYRMLCRGLPVEDRSTDPAVMILSLWDWCHEQRSPNLPKNEENIAEWVALQTGWIGEPDTLWKLLLRLRYIVEVEEGIYQVDRWLDANKSWLTQVNSGKKGGRPPKPSDNPARTVPKPSDNPAFLDPPGTLKTRKEGRKEGEKEREKERPPKSPFEGDENPSWLGFRSRLWAAFGHGPETHASSKPVKQAWARFYRERVVQAPMPSLLGELELVEWWYGKEKAPLDDGPAVGRRTKLSTLLNNWSEDLPAIRQRKEWENRRPANVMDFSPNAQMDRIDELMHRNLQGRRR